MNRTRKLAIAASTVAVTALIAACSGHGAGHETTTPPTPPPTGTQTPTPPPTPTPTPSGPVYLDSLYTADGTAKTTMGKCLGFTVVGNGVTFASDATVKMSGFGFVPTQFVDSTHLRVGDPATGNTCFYTPIFGTPGQQDVTIASGSDSWTIASAIEIDPMVAYNVGSIDLTRQWASKVFGAAASSAGVDVFEKKYDVDIYQISSDDTVRRYPHADFFDRSGKGLVPRMEYWNSKWPSAPLNEGGVADLFPEQGTNFFVVRDVQGQGGPGASYDVSFVADQLGDPPNGTGSTCAGAPEITVGAYHVSDLNLSNNYDPAGADGCYDTFFDEPIFGPMQDATWTVTVPAGKELRVSNYDNHWTASLYLRAITSSCDPQPNDCVKAAGHFGGGSINTVVYDNTTGSDQKFFLTWDGYSLNETVSPDDHAFLLNVELFDLPK